MQAGVANANTLVVQINKWTLYLPVVELPTVENTKFLKALSSGKFKKTLTRHKLIKRDSLNEFAANTEASIEVEPGLDGARKLYVIPKTNFNYNTTSPDPNTTISLRAVNIVIDSEDFFSESIQNDVEAYEIISENFSMARRNLNTGALLDYKIFKNQNKFYVFDLSRQKVFQGNPRKSQSIRFRCTPDAACRLKFFVAQEKTTTIDFAKPENSKTR